MTRGGAFKGTTVTVHTGIDHREVLVGLGYSLVVSSATGAEAEKSTRLFRSTHHFCVWMLISDLLCSDSLEFKHCKQEFVYFDLQVPDDRVPLSVSDVGVVCEQDGVVGHRRLARGKNATCHVAHTVQDAVVHQEVIYQQLDRERQRR